MLKHTETIRWQFAEELFDVKLTLKGLTLIWVGEEGNSVHPPTPRVGFPLITQKR